MKKFQFRGLLTHKGWIENATVVVDENGAITTILTDQSRESEYVNGYALPGFQNAHSHAFQYAMAGMSENHSLGGERDDFWGWRKNMYELALKISPPQMENVATMVYAEMVRNGYTSVAEFHYLHHTQDGKPYANESEMGERLVAAAQKVGIKITLIPMYYQRGGFGKAAEVQQRRFLSKDNVSYHRLLEASEKSVEHYENAQLGMGVHSLRAVALEDIKALGEESPKDRPFHLHISEQLKEIDDCISYTNQRPVEWLLDNLPVSDHYHLVHATHLDGAEIKGVAGTGANVVLCPTTEGNLGDGRFSLKEFQQARGQWSIGTDSHICLNPLEEFRMLDYGQRIHTHNRAIFCSQESGGSGSNALESAWRNGQKAMGNDSKSFFEIGQPLDAVVYEAEAPLLACARTEHLTNTILYSADPTCVLGTIIDGKWVSDGKHHRDHQTILESFKKSMRELW
ncbi:MAG: formimidoylglutamate deiminase [Bacteroidota bacterium]